MKLVSRLRDPLDVIGPPVSPVPLPTLVTVPGDVLVSVIVPPNATVPPPDRPVPVSTLSEEFASMVLVTPAAGMLIVPLVVIGPPVSPAPVPTLVTVPEPAPGKVWPVAKERIPLLLTERPVSLIDPVTPYSKFSVAEVLAVSLPTGSACQR